MTRLSKTHHRMLIDFAASQITTEHDAAVAEAHDKAEQQVRAAVEKKYPPADMEVLKRYGAANKCTVALVSDANGENSAQFTLSANCDPFIVPGWRPSIQGVRVHKAVEHYHRIKETADAARAEVLQNYKAFVTGCRTFDQVVKVWSGAEAMRDEICKKPSTALVDPKAIERVRASNVGAAS